MIERNVQEEIKNFYLNEKLGLRQLSRRTGVPKSSIRLFLIKENCYRFQEGYALAFPKYVVPKTVNY